MATHTVVRPALGQQVELGTLYDAANDKFLSQSILNEPMLEAVVHTADIHNTETKFGTNDSLKERFSIMGISPDLQSSIIAGLISTGGSSKYLKQKQAAFPTVHRAIYHTITTKQEKLNFASESIRESLDFGGLETGSATHMVSEITWGVRNIVAAQHQLSNDEDAMKIDTSLTSAFEDFEGEGEEDDPSMPPRYREQPPETEIENHNWEVTVYSDIDEATEEPPRDLKAARIFLRGVHPRLKATEGAKGVPIQYTLIPISFFSIFFGAAIPQPPTVPQLGYECQEQFIDLLDQVRSSQQQLNAYYHELKVNRSFIHHDHLVDVGDQLHHAREATSELLFDYTKLIKRGRSGRADSQEITRLLTTVQNGASSPKKLIRMTKEYGYKLRFINSVMGSGVQYVGFTGQSLDEMLRRNSSGTTFAFHFSNAAMKHSESWETHLQYFRAILNQLDPGCLAVIVDCDASGESLEKSHIVKFEGTQLITKDVLQQQRQLATKNLIRYDERQLDSSVLDAPAQRRAISIPCPGPNCSKSQPCDWICFKCHAPVEYGVVDPFVYCDCGRAPYETCEFKCSKESHGNTFEIYRKSALQRMLANLPPAPEVNILILGETGVGKSTFINAFVNYLTFSSLDEGLGAERLNWIIPCSFAMQTEDPASGRLVQHKVRIGADEDEVDGSKGSSATQKATVYPIYFGGKLIRLIDTPGIGDTRGADQDKKNMINVVSVLRNYPELHGILILLKPNNSRLTVMFRFCIKELLGHLHRDAARNMVFGFTNTRGSNYRPGDTFSPLESLLEEYKDVIPGLFRDTVYCFDSESFRYLAANKKGHEMGNVDDYRRSWDHSGGEAHRLLGYVQSLIPHQVRSTVSLNETRYLIEQLTAPMQKISSAIIDTIAKNKKQADDLRDTRATGQELQKKLQIVKTTPHCEELSRPLTVCSNIKCVDVRGKDDSGKEIKLRKVICKSLSRS